MSTRSLIEQILEQRRFAVTGVSRNPDKYGYLVYKHLKAAGYTVYAVNPNADSVDGDVCYPTLDNIPDMIDVVVTVTQPEVTESTIQTAGRLKIPYAWMQPGSESRAAYNLAQAFSVQAISGGPCIRVAIAEHKNKPAEAV